MEDKGRGKGEMGEPSGPNGIPAEPLEARRAGGSPGGRKRGLESGQDLGATEEQEGAGVIGPGLAPVPNQQWREWQGCWHEGLGCYKYSSHRLSLQGTPLDSMQEKGRWKSFRNGFVITIFNLLYVSWLFEHLSHDLRVWQEEGDSLGP